jgi:hypothetical protein
LNCALATESAAFLSTEETSLELFACDAPTSDRSDAVKKEVEAIFSFVVFVVGFWFRLLEAC